MRECDIGTYHEPPPIGYGYDLPNFSCTICWPLGRSFSTAASPNRQVNACRSLRCAARTCLTLQIQSSGPCGFVHFFWCTRNFGKKKHLAKHSQIATLRKLIQVALFIIFGILHTSSTPPTKKSLKDGPNLSLAPVFVASLAPLINWKLGFLYLCWTSRGYRHRISWGFSPPFFSHQDPQFMPWIKIIGVEERPFQTMSFV